MPTISIHLFGTLTVEVNGEDRSSHYSGRVQSLFAFLLLRAGMPQSRQSIAFSFWPDSTEKQARTNLRKLLLLLRGALGPHAHYLVSDDQNVYWRSNAGCWLDTASFTQTLAAADATDDVREAIRLYTQATNLYRGDLLADCYDEWILAPRELLRDQYINALDRLCTLLEGERRYGEGILAARRLIQHDPVYERGHFHLMRLQALMNDRAGALQSYHRCATLLRRELGVDPSPMMEELYLQLLDPAHTALDTSATNGADATPSIPLVGRRHAWQQLIERWQHVRAGHAHFTLITGETGIGKSRLAEEMRIWVERQGLVTAHARAYDTDQHTLTFAPVARWLRAPRIHDELARLEPYWLSEIARLLPELLIEQQEIRPPQPMVDDWQRHHLFTALAQALQPGRHPRLLVLDDLHWCDGETLVWLAYFLEHAADQRLLVIGTVRSEESDACDALHALCETLRQRGQLDEIALGPLEGGESAELAQHVASRALAPAQAQWLVETTGGNPLFVIESAHLLQDQRGGFTQELQSEQPLPPSLLPESIVSVIEARLARLSEAASAVVEVAATIGRSFTFPVLKAAIALDENRVVDALDELWRRRIIREDEDGSYDFSHDRIRDVAYARASATRRRYLHKRVAAAIAQTYRDRIDAVSGELGYHYEQAGARLAAIEHYTRAAAVAAAQFAHHEAEEYANRVSSLSLPEETPFRVDALARLDHAVEPREPAAWQENLRQLCELHIPDSPYPMLTT